MEVRIGLLSVSQRVASQEAFVILGVCAEKVSILGTTNGRIHLSAVPAVFSFFLLQKVNNGLLFLQLL